MQARARLCLSMLISLDMVAPMFASTFCWIHLTLRRHSTQSKNNSDFDHSPVKASAMSSPCTTFVGSKLTKSRSLQLNKLPRRLQSAKLTRPRVMLKRRSCSFWKWSQMHLLRKKHLEEEEKWRKAMTRISSLYMEQSQTEQWPPIPTSAKIYSSIWSQSHRTSGVKSRFPVISTTSTGTTGSLWRLSMEHLSQWNLDQTLTKQLLSSLKVSRQMKKREEIRILHLSHLSSQSWQSTWTKSWK